MLACAAVSAIAEDPAPAVRIVKMTVDGRTGPPETTYPPGRGNVEIAYALVEPAEGVQFRYKLKALGDPDDPQHWETADTTWLVIQR